MLIAAKRTIFIANFSSTHCYQPCRTTHSSPPIIIRIRPARLALLCKFLIQRHLLHLPLTFGAIALHSLPATESQFLNVLFGRSIHLLYFPLSFITVILRISLSCFQLHSVSSLPADIFANFLILLCAFYLMLFFFRSFFSRNIPSQQSDI